MFSLFGQVTKYIIAVFCVISVPFFFMSIWQQHLPNETVAIFISTMLVVGGWMAGVVIYIFVIVFTVVAVSVIQDALLGNPIGYAIEAKTSKTVTARLRLAIGVLLAFGVATLAYVFSISTGQNTLVQFLFDRATTACIITSPIIIMYVWSEYSKEARRLVALANNRKYWEALQKEQPPA